MTSREGLKKLMLRTAVFNYLPPKSQGKSRFLTIFYKNCPGRYSKVMEEWRSLPHVIEYSPDFSEDVFEDKQEQFTNNVPNLAISEINRIVSITNFKVVCVQALTITLNEAIFCIL